MAEEVTEEAPQLTELQRLTQEFARLSGPLDAYGEHIQRRNHLHDFMKTEAGATLVGNAIHRAQAAIDVIVNPNINRRSVLIAVYELRVQHRLLEDISAVINAGRNAEAAILLEDDLTEDPEDEHPG